MTCPRLVALGDGLVVGRDDPASSGGWIGWVPRLAAHLRLSPDEVHNAGVDGATVREVAELQLPAVATYRPEIVGLVCGVKDALAGTEMDEAITAVMKVVRWHREVGALLIMPTLPKLPPHDAIPELTRRRTERWMTDFNARLSTVGPRHGMCFVRWHDLPGHDSPGNWSRDGIHLSTDGHVLLARAMADVAYRELPFESQLRLRLGTGLPSYVPK